MTCVHCVSCQLDRIEALLAAERTRDTARHTQILERLTNMANTIDTLRDQFRDNTTLVAERIDRLIAQIQADADNTASPETLADMQTLADHLRELGTDPSNPVPQLAARRT